MPPTIVTDEGLTVTEFPLATVEYKNTLADASWLPQTHLYVDKLTIAVNSYDEAQLTRYIGRVLQPGTDFFADYLPLNLLGKYIRITIPAVTPADPPPDPPPPILTDFVWVGYVISTAKEREAVVGATPPAHLLTGKAQVMQAVGLEWFLDRVQINSSRIYPTTKIERAIPFNGGQGVSLDSDTRTRANRSAAVNVDGTHAFVPANQLGSLWTLGQICNYLITYYTTQNTANAKAPTNFIMDAQDALDGVLDGVAPSFNPENMTTFQILNRLLSPQRGFVWWLEFDDALPGGVGRIRVETIATANITLPAGGIIPANRDQQTLDFDKERDVDDTVTAEFGPRAYHQIICRGARMTGTGTFGRIGDTVHELVEDWTAAMATQYIAGASLLGGEPPYAALSPDGKADRNDAVRKQENLVRVFSYFRIASDWDGKTTNGVAGDWDDDRGVNYLFPVLNDAGAMTGAGLPFSINGLRILNDTRLKRGWDYGDPTTPVQNTPAGTEADYMPMFALLKVSEGDPAATPPTSNKWQFSEKMNETNFAEGEDVSEKISISYGLQSQPNTPGIILNAGGMQHACALNHWGGAEPTKTNPQVDYATLRVTCTIEADFYCEGKYPDDAAMPAGVPLQRLVVFLGDDYRLDWMAGFTAYDLQNGSAKISLPGALRDDRKRCRDVARLMFEWYQQNRRPITVQFRQLRNIWRLGMMVTTIGAGSTVETVNTVVSMVTFDCAKGVTTIKTHDVQLDFVQVT